MRFFSFFLVLFLAFVVNSQNQTGSNSTMKEFTRFDIGYERISAFPHRGVGTNSVAIEFEKSFKRSTMFSRNYRFSIGLNDSNQFYMHVPGGPILGVIAAIAATKNGNNGCAGMGVGALLFILPDGIGFTAVQNEKIFVGMYANFIGFDYTNRNYKAFDYAPDFGVRMNLYFGNTMFAFARISGKYSTAFAGWAGQGTAGIGWDFD